MCACAPLPSPAQARLPHPRHPRVGRLASALSLHLLLPPPAPQFKLWRLDFSGVGSHWHAFAGWDCAAPAQQFDRRMAGLTKPWPAPSGGGAQPLAWTSGRTFSAEPDLKQDCPAGGGGLGTAGGAAAAARRLTRQLAQRWSAEELLRDL